MDKLTVAMKNLTIEKKKPPPLKHCKRCMSNIGSDVNGLCATCDPNHRWWTNSEKRILGFQDR